MYLIKHIIGLTIFFILLSSQAFSHEPANQVFRRDWTVIATIKGINFSETLKHLGELDYDIAGVDLKTQTIDVLIDDQQYRNLVNEGFEVTVSETKGVTKKPDDEYKNPDEITSIVIDYANRYPELTKVISIGKSLEGRDIWAIKISDNADLDETDEPSVLFNSMHHAREIMTPEVSIDIIEQLLTRYGKDNKITNWVNTTEIWVIPMFNVDGNNKMWNYDSWWRKNTRGGFGVDLNRNYPAGWGSCNGSSGSESSQTYRGPNPASEPETQAMMSFIENVRPVFDISYHSYSELVIYPYGCGKKRTQTKEVVEPIGKEIASLIDYSPGTAWELLYNADGGDIDWMYEAYQVIPFVIELNASKEGFHPKYSKWRNKTVERNRVGWQFLLDRVHQSGVRGLVIDQLGQKVSDFKVNVSKMVNGSKEFFQTYIGHKTGAYHLVLNPGEYILEIMKDKKILKSEEVKISNDLERMDISIGN